MKVIIGSEGLQAEELISLYDAAGWGRAADYRAKRLEQAICNTPILVQAHLEGRLVGVLRAFGDGVMNTHVGEVLVHPAFRAKGVGTQLMEALLTEFPITAGLYVDSFPESQRFFERFGLKRRDLLRFMSASSAEWLEAKRHLDAPTSSSPGSDLRTTASRSPGR